MSIGVEAVVIFRFERKLKIEEADTQVVRRRVEGWKRARTTLAPPSKAARAWKKSRARQPPPWKNHIFCGLFIDSIASKIGEHVRVAVYEVRRVFAEHFGPLVVAYGTD